MAITSEIIGKLGGAGVEAETVAGKVITSSNTVVHTVEVPPGKQVLVSFIGRFSKVSDLADKWPALRLGAVEAIARSTSRDVAISAVLTQTSTLTVSASSGIDSATLSGGTVYTAEM